MELLPAMDRDTTFLNIPLHELIKMSHGKKYVLDIKRNYHFSDGYVSYALTMFCLIYGLDSPALPESDKKYLSEWMTVSDLVSGDRDHSSDRERKGYPAGTWLGVPFTHVLQMAWGQRNIKEYAKENGIDFVQLQTIVGDFLTAHGLNSALKDFHEKELAERPKRAKVPIYHEGCDRCLGKQNYADARLIQCECVCHVDTEQST